MLKKMASFSPETLRRKSHSEDDQGQFAGVMPEGRSSVPPAVDKELQELEEAGLRPGTELPPGGLVALGNDLQAELREMARAGRRR